MAKRNDLMRCDIKESREAFTLEMDLPGCDRDKMQVYVEDGYLKVYADLRRESQAKALRTERFAGQCERTFQVGDIETADVTASYRNGVLKLVIPKSAYEKREKKTTITIG
ncbi:MAG: Hsp20 family protein [Lachnospiraceae bacterium]|nr:Hsp20 family protein [Lachnospiraceae bacterium]MCD8124217.1 Hsp20 family protein [Lachnospiraceae bacterium]